MLCLVGVLILGTHAHFSVSHNYAFAISSLKLLRFSACACYRLSSVFLPPDPPVSPLQALLLSRSWASVMATLSVCWLCLVSAAATRLFVLLGIAFYFLLIEVAAITFFSFFPCMMYVCVFVGVCYFSFFNTHWHRTTHIHNKWRLLLSFYCLIYVLPVFAILIKNVFITAQNADEWAE